MKVAFCFPGQGSVEPGMGREIADAVVEARAVYTRGSAASNSDCALSFSIPCCATRGWIDSSVTVCTA